MITTFLTRQISITFGQTSNREGIIGCKLWRFGNLKKTYYGAFGTICIDCLSSNFGCRSLNYQRTHLTMLCLNGPMFECRMFEHCPATRSNIGSQSFNRNCHRMHQILRYPFNHLQETLKLNNA